MLIQFTKETSGRATGDYHQPGRSLLREGASRNPAIQLRAVALRSPTPVASSRGEEMTTHQSLLSRCCSALIDIAAVVAGVLLICAAGLGIAFAAFVLIFVSL